jgi:hypothetical protein
MTNRQTVLFYKANRLLAHPPPTVKKKKQQSLSSCRSHPATAHITGQLLISHGLTHGVLEFMAPLLVSRPWSAPATSLSRLTHAALLVGGSSTRVRGAPGWIAGGSSASVHVAPCLFFSSFFLPSQGLFRYPKRAKKFCTVTITSNLWTYVWSIKCR